MGTVLLKFYKKRWVIIYFTSHDEKTSSTCLPFEKISLCEQIWYFFGWKLLHWIRFGQRICFELYFHDSACFVEVLFGKQRAKRSGFGRRGNAGRSNFTAGFILQRDWMVRSQLSKLAVGELPLESRVRPHYWIVRFTKTGHKLHNGEQIPSTKLLPSASRTFKREVLKEQSESKEVNRKWKHNNGRQRFERVHASLD